MKKVVFSIYLTLYASFMINAQGLVSGSQVDKARNQAILFTVFAAVVIIGIVVSIIKRRRNHRRN